MKRYMGVLPIVPSLAVALLCLFRDESLLSLLKKAFATYLFSAFIGHLYWYLWRIACNRGEQEKGGESVSGKREGC